LADEELLPDCYDRDLVRSTKQFAEESAWRSWWHFWSTLGVLASLVTVVCIAEPWYVRLSASFLFGLVNVRMFILYHDYEHGTLLGNSRFAGWVLKGYGLAALNPSSIWRRSHDHHHRNNAKIFGASIGSYPVMTVEAYRNAKRSERLAYAISRNPATIALGYLTIFLWGMCLRSLLTNPRLHFDSAVALVLHFGLLIWALLVSPSLAILLIVLPTGVAAALGAYLFYAQHNFPGVRLRPRNDWTYVFAALHSSSFIHMGPILRWLTGDIGYHHVHHLNARIPFYRLAEAMAGIKGLQSPVTTSLSVADIWRCFRLKLWDDETDRMVPFSAAFQPTRATPA